ncbi:MAG: DUF898 family protein, partial [Candidatus Binatia bacterium]
MVQRAQPTCKSCGAEADGSAASPGPAHYELAGSGGAAAFSSPKLPRIQESSRETEREPEVRRLSFHGTGGSLFGIRIVNMFLILVTFGLYSFWAKVRVRRYLMSQTEF